MERLSIDDIIEHCHRKIEWYEKFKTKEYIESEEFFNTNYGKEYWEHKQVADYLEELKHCKKFTKDMVKQIFDYGATFNFARSNPDKFHGTFPTDSYEKALDFVYRLVVENERDEECLQCKRYHSESCIGTINREREEITEGNRCAAFSKYQEGEK